ncbi:hypothetical protein [Flavobacterium sp. 3HN19-14]|uniref:hypothetical protein n=1 Tax=Flavobacterium sp. 3HN19-14 TaxID=3448133 RepID=UPI003EE122AD
MSYIKYTQYIYLVAAVFFAYKSLEVWNEATDMHWLYAFMAGMAVVMFFVRRKFANINSRPKN